MNDRNMIDLTERAVKSIEVDYSRRLFRSKFLAEKIEKDFQAMMDVVAHDMGFISAREVPYSHIKEMKERLSADLVVDSSVIELKYHTNIKCKKQLKVVNKDISKIRDNGLKGYVVMFQGTDVGAVHKKYGKMISFEDFEKKSGYTSEDYDGELVFVGRQEVHGVQVQYTIIKV